MKKLAQILRKLNSPIIHAIAMCVAGIAFITLSERVLDIAILALGALIALVAISLIAGWALADREAAVLPLARHTAILKGSLMLLFGISLMLVRSSVSRPVCVTLGILLALYSVFRLSRPSRSTLNRGVIWYAEGIILVFLIFLGALVAILPIYHKITAGTAMLAFGAKLIFDIIAAPSRRRKAERAERKAKRGRPHDIYSNDFKDKSNSI